MPLTLAFDPERSVKVCEQTIAVDMGLSAREAEVAALLASALDVPQIAARLGLSVETVRSHLKAVFAKANVHSQAQLVRRILGGPAALM